MGKSSLALRMARHIATQGTCLFFSSEMTGEQLATKLICGEVGIPSDAVRKGTISPEERVALEKTREGFKELPLIFIDRPANIIQLSEDANALRQEWNGLSAVFIDPLQGISCGFEKQITRELKVLAKQLDCPVVVLSQLSPSVDKRNNKRPLNSDLPKEASEEDADVVLCVYRDEYYYYRDSEEPNVAELIVTKNRSGETGSVKLEFVNGNFYNPGESPDRK